MDGIKKEHRTLMLEWNAEQNKCTMMAIFTGIAKVAKKQKEIWMKSRDSCTGKQTNWHHRSVGWKARRVKVMKINLINQSNSDETKKLHDAERCWAVLNLISRNLFTACTHFTVSLSACLKCILLASSLHLAVFCLIVSEQYARNTTLIPDLWAADGF